MPIKAPRWDAIRDVGDLSERVRKELELFFLSAVAFEHRDLEILGWGSPGDALELIHASGKVTA